MKKGLVTKLIGGLYTICDLETKLSTVCNASGKLRYSKVSKDSFFKKDLINKDLRVMKISPKVGDVVFYDEKEKYIYEIEERKNSLRRPDIANVDQVILIFAATNPKFSFNLLDHFIVIIEKEQIKIKIVITKIDLLNNDELQDLKEKLAYYEKIGYEVLYTSKITKPKKDIEDLFKDKISVLAGQTGAGKSTLMNALDASLTLATQEISKALGRGKHTTRHSQLHPFNGGLIADTPGFSSLDFANFSVEDLALNYVDFKELGALCKYKGCKHINEPNCMVKELVKENEILSSRYENYVKFYDEIRGQKKKY